MGNVRSLRLSHFRDDKKNISSNEHVLIPKEFLSDYTFPKLEEIIFTSENLLKSYNSTYFRRSGICREEISNSSGY